MFFYLSSTFPLFSSTIATKQSLLTLAKYLSYFHRVSRAYLTSSCLLFIAAQWRRVTFSLSGCRTSYPASTSSLHRSNIPYLKREKQVFTYFWNILQFKECHVHKNVNHNKPHPMVPTWTNSTLYSMEVMQK